MTEKTKKLVLAALMCALTCVATMVIRIPTPTMGYIHPGALAAGIGSMLSDLFSGYLSYVPATFIIKALTALLAGVIACGHKKAAGINGGNFRELAMPRLIIGGIVGEAFMVIGYFFFEIFLMAVTTGDGFSSASLAAGAASAISGVPFNIVQGLFGVVVSCVLYPCRNPDARRNPASDSYRKSDINSDNSLAYAYNSKIS